MLSSRIDLRTADPLLQPVRDSAFTSLKSLSFYPSTGVCSLNGCACTPGPQIVSFFCHLSRADLRMPGFKDPTEEIPTLPGEDTPLRPALRLHRNWPRPSKG